MFTVALYVLYLAYKTNNFNYKQSFEIKINERFTITLLLENRLGTYSINS